MTTTNTQLRFSIPHLPSEAGNRELGRWGETLAAAFLEARGYEIVERNWRSRNGELDIVAFSAEREALVAVEVKTRRAGGQVPAEEAVGAQKYARLRRLFTEWLAGYEGRAPNIAIDHVAVRVERDGSVRLEHREDLS